MNEQTENTKKITRHTLLIKKCHCCGELNESPHEPERCSKCGKSFLPSRYFDKVHAKNTEEFKQLFALSEDLHEEDLVKGLHVLW
jgi:uncharacterized OB-fold protein